HRQHGDDYGHQPQAATLGVARGAATGGFLAAEHAIEAALQLAEGLVQIRRTLAVAATAAAPRVLVVVVRVATRLVPSHSALHQIKRRRARGAPLNATECRTKAAK